MRNKYHNKKVVANGIEFDSKKEAGRWMELQIMEKAGLITNLRRQVRYQLTPTIHIAGVTLRSSNYVADFVYSENGEEVVEDVKGMRTTEYVLKKKFLAFRYGILVREV